MITTVEIVEFVVWTVFNIIATLWYGKRERDGKSPLQEELQGGISVGLSFPILYIPIKVTGRVMGNTDLWHIVVGIVIGLIVLILARWVIGRSLAKHIFHLDEMKLRTTDVEDVGTMVDTTLETLNKE